MSKGDSRALLLLPVLLSVLLRGTRSIQKQAPFSMDACTRHGIGIQPYMVVPSVFYPSALLPLYPTPSWCSEYYSIVTHD